MKKSNRESWERNRFMSKRPKRDKGWCNRCDREIVELGKKCPHCGTRHYTKRYKDA